MEKQNKLYTEEEVKELIKTKIKACSVIPQLMKTAQTRDDWKLRNEELDSITNGILHIAETFVLSDNCGDKCKDYYTACNTCVAEFKKWQEDKK